MQHRTPDDAGETEGVAAESAPDDAYLIDVAAIPSGKFAEPKPGRHHPRGRFYRPELYSTTEKLGSSVALKVGLVCALTIAAGTLIVLAVSTGAIL
ncbi:hypothetical protein [Herbiconiux liukaitaii]|uniref:hypothetical protein n=1 Tax=Herbiconiux liukaitaii TaxID=3342799 RepID=UPI0035B9F299